MSNEDNVLRHDFRAVGQRAGGDGRASGFDGNGGGPHDPNMEERIRHIEEAMVTKEEFSSAMNRTADGIKKLNIGIQDIRREIGSVPTYGTLFQFVGLVVAIIIGTVAVMSFMIG